MHEIKFKIKVKDEDFQSLKGKIPNKLFDEMEMRRELAIMNEVRKAKGNNILEKIGNTLDAWEKENNTVKINSMRYKLKYKY